MPTTHDDNHQTPVKTRACNWRAALRQAFTWLLAGVLVLGYMGFHSALPPTAIGIAAQ